MTTHLLVGDTFIHLPENAGDHDTLNNVLLFQFDVCDNKGKTVATPLPFTIWLGKTCAGFFPPHPPPLPVPLLPPTPPAQLNFLAKDKAWLDAHLLSYQCHG